MSLISTILAAGIVWSGITPENHLGGRPASPGYLQGKVILVDCRDYSADRQALERLEDFWKCYKVKPFVLLGSHRGEGEELVKKNLQDAGVTFPVYADAAFEAKTFRPQNGLVYVINQGGKMVAKTRDLNRAFESVVNSIAWGAVPGDERKYRLLIDYELGVLPGKAYLHLKEMQKAFPKAAKFYDSEYEKLEADEEVRKVAHLEEVTRQVKDFDPNMKRNGKALKVNPAKITELIESAAPLKESKNPLIVQEVKNCIADLKWAMAEL